MLVHGSWIDHHNWDGVVPALARSMIETLARTSAGADTDVRRRRPRVHVTHPAEYVEAVVAFIREFAAGQG